MSDAEAADKNVEDSKPVEGAEPQFIELYSGAALNATEAEVITLRSPTQLVVFAGAEGSGKTTLLASIYERLNQGDFAGFRFARSRSLLGFEEICHLNRIASGGTLPETLRTRLTDDTKYYHLALRAVETPSAPPRNVLFSDTSGELFRMAKDSREDAERLTFLRRADTIVVLVDGERLATPALRTSARADAADILESVIDAKLISANCRVEFVFSKFDRITAAGHPALDFLADTQAKFEGRFRRCLPHLSFRQIAARPAPPLPPVDGGLIDAFASWTTMALPSSTDEHFGQQVPPLGIREFGKFGWRHFEGTRRNA